MSPELVKLSQLEKHVKCANNAPYFALWLTDTSYKVLQGCCNDWTCPRCGIMRAKAEYGRIVNGCKILSEKHGLWFITITCRGKEMSQNEADTLYGEWTNKLFTRWRAYAKRHNQEWCYVQVTERQKRGHPHSHILTTWKPPKMEIGLRSKYETLADGSKVWTEREVIFSDYVRRSCKASGLGDQYDISRVASVEGASRYVAKYLFKDNVFTTEWQKHWRRVRYSQNFPKMDKAKGDAFVLMTREDWSKLAGLATIITSDSVDTKEYVAEVLGWTNILVK